MRRTLCLLILSILLPPGWLLAQSFAIGDSTFLLDGKPFQIISGEMHYARIPPEYWRDRLMKARSMGLNTVATYVFWNIHEPRPGRFVFDGAADVAKFVRIAKEVGLYVILRPGPYACAEWDFGGYPAWLLADSSLKVRTGDPRFLEACHRYLAALGGQLRTLQSTHGGPIILVQVENEYGSFGHDTSYIGKVRDMVRDAGFDVPLFSADGPSQIRNAFVDGVFPGVNGATGEDILKALRPYRPKGPFFVPEFYPGWLDHWGEPHASVGAKETAEAFEWMLSHGISVSLYMFHGGTNFGFMNGANYGGHYQPQPTSYDYDAPLDEAGRPTPKYFLLRQTIAKVFHTGDQLPPVPESPPAISVPDIAMHRAASVTDILPQPVESERPLPMEEIGQAYGYILYRTTIDSPIVGTLALRELRDYAVVSINGVRQGSLDRRYHQDSLTVRVTSPRSTLDILVENGGRINYGPELQSNRKGITDSVLLNGKPLRHWKMYPFPMDDTTMRIPAAASPGGFPALYAGTFTLERTGDTWLDMRGWEKGMVRVNGHNLGRYWYIGPQQTLYLPGAWLRRGTNTVSVFELENAVDPVLRARTDPVLNELRPDRLKPPRPVRPRGPFRFAETSLIAKGSFNAGDDPQDVLFPPVAARYVCLQSLSSQKGDHFASIAELYLLDDAKRALPRSGWKIYTVDSEELDAEDGRAENAIDGNLQTIWHTEWGSAQPGHPHMIILDLGEVRHFSGLRYISRRGDLPGKIKEFRAYSGIDQFPLR